MPNTDTLHTCTQCGDKFEYNPRTKWPTRRPACIRAYRREYQRRRNAAERTDIRQATKVTVLGVAPFVKDAEARYELWVYKDTVWPAQEFEENVKVGNFNGLLVERRGQVYTVANSRMMEAQQPGRVEG